MSATEVTFGAGARNGVAAGPFLVSAATFPAGLIIPDHYHEWSVMSVLVSGRFEQRFAGRICDCPPGVVVAKPAGERHADGWYNARSHHVIWEIDPARHGDLGPCRSVAEEIAHVDRIGAQTIAQLILRELRDPDTATSVALEGLTYQLLARVQRGRWDDPRRPRVPSWLRRVREYLHDNYRSPVRLYEVANAVGVHPDSLSRAFPAAFGINFGEYLRRLRVEAAVALLAGTDRSIARIAQQTGFADQSHLTRVVKRMTGHTPMTYRAGFRGGDAGEAHDPPGCVGVD